MIATIDHQWRSTRIRLAPLGRLRERVVEHLIANMDLPGTQEEARRRVGQALAEGDNAQALAVAFIADLAALGVEDRGAA